MSPLHLAVERGYFDEAGAAIEIVQYARSAQAVPVMAAGELDVIFATVPPAVANAVRKGANVRVVAGREIASTECGESTVFYANSESFPDGLNHVAQLRGKTISASERAAISEFFVETMLAAGGLTSKDVEIVYLRQSEAAGALLGGRIDLMLSSGQQYVKAFQSGKVFPAFELAEFLPDFQYSFTLFGDRMLREENLDLGVRFLSAYRQGAREFLAGATPRFMRDFALKQDLDLDLVVGACRETFLPDADIKMEDLDRLLRYYHERGYIEAPAVRAADIVDLRFLRKLDEGSGE